MIEREVKSMAREVMRDIILERFKVESSFVSLDDEGALESDELV
jgi:hypothetical protein